MLNLSFNWRLEDLEFRISHCNLKEPEAPTPELVKWEKVDDKERCYTLAMWHKTKDCWQLEAVGSRFFDAADESSLDGNELLKAIKYFDKLLNVWFSMEEIESDL